MLKVLILDRCPHCDGEAYIFAGEALDYKGEYYPRYAPCPYCKGSGEQDKWISLREFADLLERELTFEPDYGELARQHPVSQYQDSRDAAGI